MVFHRARGCRKKRPLSALSPILSPSQTPKTHSRQKADSHAPVSVDLSRCTSQGSKAGPCHCRVAHDSHHTEEWFRGWSPPGKRALAHMYVILFSAQTSCSLPPTCVCPRHRGLQKLTSPSSSHDKYERFENPNQAVTNKITCCLHLVVIIRALMTGEELIEMKITPRRVRCVHGSAWTLHGYLEW